jgi:hypothetical protein
VNYSLEVLTRNISIPRKLLIRKNYHRRKDTEQRPKTNHYQITDGLGKRGFTPEVRGLTGVLVKQGWADVGGAFEGGSCHDVLVVY